MASGNVGMPLDDTQGLSFKSFEEVEGLDEYDEKLIHKHDQLKKEAKIIRKTKKVKKYEKQGQQKMASNKTASEKKHKPVAAKEQRDDFEEYEKTKQVAHNVPLELNQANLRQAMIWSEVIGEPVCKKRHRRVGRP